MLRVVIWEDDPNHIDLLVAAVEEAAARVGLSVQVVGHQAEWPKHLKDEIVHPGPKLWLIDVKTNLKQKGKKDVETDMRRALSVDSRLNGLYQKTSNQVKAFSHNGLYVAMMANGAQIDFRACSHAAETAGEILAYLATGSTDAPKSDWMIDKGKLTQRTLDLGDVSLEVDRLGQILRSTLNKCSLTAAPASQKSGEGASDSKEKSTANNDETGNVLQRSGRWRLSIRICSGLGAVLALIIASANLPQVQRFLERRSIEIVTVTDLVAREEITKLELNERTTEHAIGLTLHVVNHGYGANLSAYLLTDNGDIELLDTWEKTIKADFPSQVGEKWHAHPGFNILLILAEHDDTESMTQIEPLWALAAEDTCKDIVDFTIDYEPEERNDSTTITGYYADKQSIPFGIQSILDILEKSYEEGRLDDFRIIGFLMPASSD